jgi:integrase/recombinase XerD
MGASDKALIEQFLEMLVASRGAARNSREAYERDLTDFASFYKNDLLTAQKNNLEAWLADLHKRQYSPRSIARKLSALRQFFHFLYEEEHRADDPTTQLDSPKQPKSLPKLLSGAEIAQLLTHLTANDTPEGLRLRAMVELLYASGLRVSELVSLPYASANRLLKSGEPLLLIKGKGGKERMVPVHGQAQASLKAYLAIRGLWIKTKGDEKFLFPSGSEQGYLTRQRLGQLLKAAALDAGLNPARISPHVLRHSFASHLLAGGADLRVIQELLGHAHLVTTEIYTHIMPEKLRALVAQHPLAE